MGVDTEVLVEEHDGGASYRSLSEQYGISIPAIKSRMSRYKRRKPRSAERPAFRGVSESPFPMYDKPLSGEGDFLCLFDTEFPFHEHEFLNRVLELAQAFHVNQLVIGGDMVHLECLSAWGAAWKADSAAQSSLTEQTEAEWRGAIKRLPEEYQAELLAKLDAISGNPYQDDELMAAKDALCTLSSMFSKIQVVLGNHDDRLLRRLNSPMMPRKLLDFLGLTQVCWEIGPYYHSVIRSGGEDFRIEHPKSAAPGTAIRQADKFEQHAIVGHSHLQSVQWSTSGKHYAIQAGHIVDERRLAYAQRPTNQPAHVLGAVLLLDGFPHLIHPKIDWARFRRMARCTTFV